MSERARDYLDGALSAYDDRAIEVVAELLAEIDRLRAFGDALADALETAQEHGYANAGEAALAEWREARQ